MNRDQIIRSQEDVQFTQLQLAAGLHFGFVKDDEVVAVILFNLWTLVFIAAILDGQRMKAEFAREVLEVFAGGISDVNPDDLRRLGAKIGDEIGIADVSERLR